MGMSNWNIIAWDENGKCCNGSLELKGKKGKWKIEIYKNWVNVYLNDYDKALMTIDYSMMSNSDSYAIIRTVDWEMFVGRGSQQAIFVYVRGNCENEIKIMFGIGAYCDWEGMKCLGIREETIKEFFEWLKNLKDKEVVEIPKIKEYLQVNQGDLVFAKGDWRKVAYPIGEKIKPIIFHYLDVLFTYKEKQD